MANYAKGENDLLPRLSEAPGDMWFLQNYIHGNRTKRLI